jgi:hypothetical protein
MDCALSTYSLATGAASVSTCAACSIGHVCVSPVSIASCAAGTFGASTALSSQTQCTLCPVNHFCAGVTGLNDTCSAGRYSYATGATSAAVCKQDCQMLASLPGGFTLGNCTALSSFMHAGEFCEVGIADGYGVKSGSAAVTCPAAGGPSVLFTPPVVGLLESRLSALSFTVGTLYPSFNSTTLSYALSMNPSVTSLQLTATLMATPVTSLMYSKDGTTYVAVTSGVQTALINGLIVGTTVLRVRVIPEAGSDTRVYTIALISNDASLLSLVCTPGNLNQTFNGAQLNYVLGVPSAAASVSCTPSKPGATIEWSLNAGGFTPIASGASTGSISVTPGTDVINFLVTSSDSVTQQTYSVRVLWGDATLTALSFDVGMMNTSFTGSLRGYALGVPDSTIQLRVTGTVNNPAEGQLMQWSIDGSSWNGPLTSGVQGGPMSIVVGTTRVYVRVTAQDNSVAVYFVDPQTTNTTLTGMVFSNGALVGGFKPSTIAYVLGVSNGTRALTLTVSKPPPLAGVTVSVATDVNGPWTPISIGSPSSLISVLPGTTTVYVSVTAAGNLVADGYTIDIKYNNPRLVELQMANTVTVPVWDRFSAGPYVTGAAPDATSVSLRAVPVTGALNSLDWSVDNGGSWTAFHATLFTALVAPVTVGQTIIRIRAVATDAVSEQNYYLHVRSNDASLASLMTNASVLAPAFNASRLLYNVTLPGGSNETVALTPTASSNNASVHWSRNGGAFNLLATGESTTAAPPPAINADTVLVRVTAGDLSTVRTYSIDVLFAPCTGVAPTVNTTVGDCPADGVLRTGRSCTLVPKFLFTLHTGSLTMQCVNGVLSPYPVLYAVIFPPPIVSFVLAPSSWQVGVGQTLILLANVIPSAGQTGFLRYTWTVRAQSDALAGTAARSLGSTADPWLNVNPNTVKSGENNTITLTVSDVNPAHSYGAGLGGPSASVSHTVFVSAPPSLQVQVDLSTPTAAAFDPCANTTLTCAYGGTCAYTQSNNGGVATYSLYCRCPTEPVQFYGAMCELAVLDCPSCISPYRGGASAVVYGVGLDSIYRMQIAGQSVTFDPATVVPFNASVSAETKEMLARFPQFAGSMQMLSFVSPSLVPNITAATNASYSSSSSTGGDGGFEMSSYGSASASSRSLLSSAGNPASAYKLLTLDSLLLSAGKSVEVGFLQLNFTSMVFYSSSTCVLPGQWIEDGYGGCMECPEGGVCPGGGRVWPMSEYWSWSEYQAPVKCPILGACTGVQPSSSGNRQNNAEAFTDTRQCSIAYTDQQCTQCFEGYYLLNGQCFFCGSTTDQSATIALTLIVCVAAMGVLAIAVALLPARRLSRVIQLFTLLQTAAMVGVSGARDSPYFGSELTLAFSYINLLNFDIEVLRPGCGGIPDFTYIRKFQFTLVIVAFALVMFLLACVIRLLMRMRANASGRVTAHDQEELVHEAEFVDHGGSGGRGGGTADELDVGDDSEGAATASTKKKRAAQRLQQLDGATADSMFAGLTPMQQRIMQRAAHMAAAWSDAKQRAVHSVLILFAIFYLRITILLLKAFSCSQLPDPSAPTDSEAVTTFSLILEADGQTKCFVGDHLAFTIGCAILLLVYTFGFPLWCFILLMRAFSDDQTKGVLGWLRQKLPCLRGRVTAAARASAARRALIELQQAPNQSPSSAGVGKRLIVAEKNKSNSAVVADSSTRIAVKGGSGHELAGPVSASSAAAERELAELDRLVAEEEKHAVEVQRRRENRYGFLFLTFRPGCFFACSLVFAVSCASAFIEVFIADKTATLRIFLFSLLWSAQCTLIALYLPYSTQAVNIKNVLVVMAMLLHSTMMLALQRGGSKSGYFITMILIFCALVILMLFRSMLIQKLPCLRAKRATDLPSAEIELASPKVAPEPLDDRRKASKKHSEDDDDDLLQIDSGKPAQPSRAWEASNEHPRSNNNNNNDEVALRVRPRSASSRMSVEREVAATAAASRVDVHVTGGEAAGATASEAEGQGKRSPKASVHLPPVSPTAPSHVMLHADPSPAAPQSTLASPSATGMRQRTPLPVIRPKGTEAEPADDDAPAAASSAGSASATARPQSPSRSSKSAAGRRLAALYAAAPLNANANADSSAAAVDAQVPGAAAGTEQQA